MEDFKKTDKKNSFDTQKFEMEKDDKKLSLTKEEYAKWFNDQVKSREEKTNKQGTSAKKFAIIFGVAFIVVVFTLTITLVVVL